MMAGIVVLAVSLNAWLNRDQPPDEAWRETFRKSAEPLDNFPQIVGSGSCPHPYSSAISDGRYVIFRNVGRTTLQYMAYHKSKVQDVPLYWELFQGGKWRKWKDSGACGVGLHWIDMKPQETVKIWYPQFDNEGRERVLTLFAEKGSKRIGLVAVDAESRFSGSR